MVDSPLDAPMETADAMQSLPEVTEEAAPADQTMHGTDTMADVQIAAVSPVVPLAETVTPAVAIDVPDDAGPLPLREAAAAGDAMALFEIGSRYAGGGGGKPDMSTAAQWYEKSAELGFAPAQYRIGNMY